MEIILRSQEHTDQEKQILHKLSFSVLDGVDYESGDTTDNILTGTADLDGFTTLRSICRVLNWDKDIVQLDVNGCNEMGKCRLISDEIPSLFMIPKSLNTEYVIEHPEYNISELIKVGHYFRSKTIQFTQYSFLESFPKTEILSILILLLNPVMVPKIEKFYWEIDSRYVDEMKNLYLHTVENVYRRKSKELQVVHGKKFKFILEEVIGNIGISYLDGGN